MNQQHPAGACVQDVNVRRAPERQSLKATGSMKESELVREDYLRKTLCPPRDKGNSETSPHKSAHFPSVSPEGLRQPGRISAQFSAGYAFSSIYYNGWRAV